MNACCPLVALYLKVMMTLRYICLDLMRWDDEQAHPSWSVLAPSHSEGVRSSVLDGVARTLHDQERDSELGGSRDRLNGDEVMHGGHTGSIPSCLLGFVTFGP